MKPKRPLPAQRPAQETPAEIVADLMGAIRGQFYADLPEQKWWQDQRLIKSWVVLWPARWLEQRGVTLRPERYKEIVLGILDTIKRHGATASVEYWPRYLAKCLQDHFKHHGDEYYEEGKALRAVVESALARAQRAQAAQPDPVRVLAEAGQVLATTTRRRTAPTQPRQAMLFDL